MSGSTTGNYRLKSSAVHFEIGERLVISEMRPSLRFMRKRSPEELKNVEEFLKAFLDRKTRTIRLDNLYAVMKGAGLKHELATLTKYFEAFPTKTPGVLSEEQYFRLIEREERQEGQSYPPDVTAQLFDFFDCHSSEGKLTPDKLIAAASQIGVDLPQQEAASMIRNFARNKRCMDKQDFVNLLSSREGRDLGRDMGPDRSRLTVSPRKG